MDTYKFVNEMSFSMIGACIYVHVLLSRHNHVVQCDPGPSPGDGEDGVDCPLGGGVRSHTALPHNAADRDDLLEVSSIYLFINMYTSKIKFAGTINSFA